jgi:hypothetical protein
VELSSVQLVAFFIFWDLVRLHGQGLHLEVAVIESIDGVDASSPVESHQILEQFHCAIAKSTESHVREKEGHE